MEELKQKVASIEQVMHQVEIKLDQDFMDFKQSLEALATSLAAFNKGMRDHVLLLTIAVAIWMLSSITAAAVITWMATKHGERVAPVVCVKPLP